MPWLFGLLIIPVVVVMVVLSVRMIRGMNNKVKEGRAEWNDEWDPFE